jgi:hypothetical protein
MAEHVERAMDEILAHQRAKVLLLARAIAPGLTEEDLRNPHDFPELIADANFNFEDGTLAGLIAARVALKRRVFAPLCRGEQPEPPLDPETVFANVMRGGE